MREIHKLSLYVNEEQYRKLCILADAKNIEPEEIANEALYSYLAIVDPYAVDDEEE